MKSIWFFLLFSILLAACSDFESSPHQVYDHESPRDLNIKNLNRLLQSSNDDTLRFIISGDSQASQNGVRRFIKRANEIPGLDIVFLAGDISEFGLLQEMEWVVKEYDKLKTPYFGVIGNHDLLANGSDVFKRMFGDLNYSFNYGGVRFICHNTNGREYKFNGKVPDIDWLRTELSGGDSSPAFVAIAHVRPFTTDFDQKLSTAYLDVLNSDPRVLASFYAHDHSFGEYRPNNSRVPMIVTTSLGEQGFLLVEIVKGRLKYERIHF